MILKIKTRTFWYKKFSKDIWGLSFTDIRPDEWNYRKFWYICFFFKFYIRRMSRKFDKYKRYIYRIDLITFRTYRKKYKKRWISLRLTRLYFFTIKDNVFRKYFKKASKLFGNLYQNYCYLLECRAVAFIYRLVLVSNIFEALRVMKCKCFFVAKKLVIYKNALVPVGKLFQFTRRWRRFFFYSLKKRAMYKCLLFNIPPFVFFTLHRFWGFLLRKPIRKELVYPIKVDLQRVTGYY